MKNIQESPGNEENKNAETMKGGNEDTGNEKTGKQGNNKAKTRGRE